MIERKGERETEMWGGGKNERLLSEGGRERESESQRTSLLGGFPEVTVLNITEECGMLNRCQGKHTDRATAAPNSRQGLLYIHTKTHKHADISVHKIRFWTLSLHFDTLTIGFSAMLAHTAHTLAETVYTCRRQNFWGKLSLLYRQSLGITVNRDGFIYRWEMFLSVSLNLRVHLCSSV